MDDRTGGPKHVICEAEEDLARRLRKHCSDTGKELHKYLPETAEILLEMGLLYTEKARQTEGILQKLTFIRASALLNGARVRYRILQKESTSEESRVSYQRKENEATEGLAKLGRDMIEAATSSASDVNLVEISKSAFAEVVKMRAKFKQTLDAMKYRRLKGDGLKAHANKTLVSLKLAEGDTMHSEYLKQATLGLVKKKNSVMPFYTILRPSNVPHEARKISARKTENLLFPGEERQITPDLIDYFKCASVYKGCMMDLMRSVGKEGNDLLDLEGKLNAQYHVPEPYRDYDLFAEEEVKINAVQKLNKTVKSDYLRIMRKIADNCVEILGPPPCRFTAVGLGSLARGDVTPYSDFEHCIVLEEGVQESERYESIKEYFRWYAVCFQLIVINFGETFIRSVGVKSLNDLANEDKSKNWFFDTHTPCGIAFDGMALHASNNPLGRQETTKLKPEPLELIQPVSEMVKLLTKESQIKNGYYVNQVLAWTCYVYGDEVLYNAFHKISQEDVGKINERLSVDDLAHIASHLENTFKDLVDVKRDMYRPVTTLLFALGRTYNLVGNDNFELIDKLAKKLFFPELLEKEAHDLKYALALACETRMRAYAEAGNQRAGMLWKEFFQMLGLASCIKFFTIRHKLMDTFTSVLYGKHKMNDLEAECLEVARSVLIKGICLRFAEKYEEAISMSEKALKENQFVKGARNSSKWSHIVFNLVHCYVAEVKSSKTPREKRVQYCENALKHINCFKMVSKERKTPLIAGILERRASVYNAIRGEELGYQNFVEWKYTLLDEIGRYEDGLRGCERDLNSATSNPSFDKDCVSWLQYFKSLFLQRLRRYEGALSFCESVQDENTHFEFHRSKARLEMSLDKRNQARKTILSTRRLVGEFSFTSDISRPTMLVILMDDQCEFGFFEDAIETFEMLKQPTVETKRFVSYHFLFSGVVSAFCFHDRIEEAVDLIKQQIRLSTEEEGQFVNADDDKIGITNEAEKAFKALKNFQEKGGFSYENRGLNHYSDFLSKRIYVETEQDEIQFRLAVSHFKIGCNVNVSVAKRAYHLQSSVDVLHEIKESYNEDIFVLYGETLREYKAIDRPSCLANFQHDTAMMDWISCQPESWRGRVNLQPYMNIVTELLTMKCVTSWYTTKNMEETVEIAVYLSTTFDQQITVPTIYMTHCNIMEMFIASCDDGSCNKEILISLLTGVQQKFRQRYSLQSESESHAYNTAIRLLSVLQLQGAAKALWKAITQTGFQHVDNACRLLFFIADACLDGQESGSNETWQNLGELRDT